MLEGTSYKVIHKLNTVINSMSVPDLGNHITGTNEICSYIMSLFALLKYLTVLKLKVWL